MAVKHQIKRKSLIVFLKKVLVALLPRNFNLKSTLSNGAKLVAKNRAGFGGRGIYIYGDSIEPEFEQLEKFIGPSNVFFDIGSNSGIYALKAAKYFEGYDGIVVAVEPFPPMISTLYYNVELNSFNNIRLRNFCAGARTGNSSLWLNENKPNIFSMIKVDNHARQISTLAVSLDDLFEWEGLDRLDYIKIDVEGKEKDVIDGAKNIIAKYRPIIQAEIIVNDLSIDLENYNIYQAPKSINKLFIPIESEKNNIASLLGWPRIM